MEEVKPAVFKHQTEISLFRSLAVGVVLIKRLVLLALGHCWIEGCLRFPPRTVQDIFRVNKNASLNSEVCLGNKDALKIIDLQFREFVFESVCLHKGTFAQTGNNGSV